MNNDVSASTVVLLQYNWPTFLTLYNIALSERNSGPEILHHGFHKFGPVRIDQDGTTGGRKSGSSFCLRLGHSF